MIGGYLHVKNHYDPEIPSGIKYISQSKNLYISEVYIIIEREMMSKIKFVKIDLSDLYEIIRPKVSAYKILKSILDQYDVNYEILLNISPDVGEEYLTNDKEFENKFSEALYVEDAFEVLEEYAEKKNAKAIIVLEDGYESAIALIYGYKDIEKEAEYLAEIFSQ